MMHLSNKDPDIITSADLPGLRNDMCRYADDEMFSGEFRAVCRGVIAAIDHVRGGNAATQAALEVALKKFMRVGNNELLLHDDRLEVGIC